MAGEARAAKVQKLIGDVIRACWDVHSKGKKLPSVVRDAFLELLKEGRLWEIDTAIPETTVKDILTEASPDLEDGSVRPPKADSPDEEP